MKLLFVDHNFHKKTHSADFFLKILRKSFDVTEHYYARAYKTGSEKAMKDQDIAVIWEFPISRSRFFFPGKRNVFVPMYDNEWGSYWQWKRIAWSGIGVISFCDKLTEHARRCGVTNLLEARYFLDPSSLPHNLGDPKKVFLWERGEITKKIAETLFPPSEGYTFVVKGANDFLPREQYLELLSSCGIVIAPRRKEDIGMAFLEAMAMGKCVVAHNDATMNEYIEDGKTGILFDIKNPTRIDFSEIEKIRNNLPEVVNGYLNRWKSEAVTINGFIANQKPSVPSLVNRLKLAISFPLYLAEGLRVRMSHV